ncbi:MAG TPA: hypothetical protein VGJ98_09195 [Candidatus Eisenbacteria bacterium]|jgi:hypothetical protein
MSEEGEEAAGRSDPDELDRELLISVREVPDEPTATLLCDFLRSQGIEATVEPVQISWFSTLQTLHHGFWGRVLVIGKDADRARALIEEYLAATPEPGPGEETA